jgi:hypothetical protein
MPVSRRRKPKQPRRPRRSGNPAVLAKSAPPPPSPPIPVRQPTGPAAEARQWLLLNLEGRPTLEATHRKVAFFERVREYALALPGDARELRDLAELMQAYPAPRPGSYPVVPIEGGDPAEDIVDVLAEVLDEREQELAGVGVVGFGEEPPEPDWTGEQAAARDVALDQADSAEFVREVIDTAGFWLRSAAEDDSGEN